MQTRELIILLLLILLAAVVIAVVVRRGNAQRAEGHRAEAQQMGTQAAWLEAADEPAPAAAPAAAQAAAAAAAGEASSVSEAAGEASDDRTDVAEPEPMTRAERRQAREAAEGVAPTPEVEASGAAGAAWAGAGPDTDPEAERIAKAAGFRDEVAGEDMLSEDRETPANEWGGPREEALDEEPTVENPVEDDLPEEAPEHPGRRISGFLELRDGGFGVGSAAPIEDGAQPMDHPVQAYRDSMTFRAPGDPGYDSAEPDIWFYDAGAAERSGFRPADD